MSASTAGAVAAGRGEGWFGPVELGGLFSGQKRMFDDDGGMHGDYRQAAPHMASSPFSAGMPALKVFSF